MARLVFKRGQQQEFLVTIMQRLSLNSIKLGSLIGISQKSMQRWLNESTLGRQESLEKLSQLSNVPLPKPIQIRPEYWGNKLCHDPPPKRHPLKRQPGSAAGRSKGGKMSQIRRRQNPEYYRSLGCIIPNNFTCPSRSPSLAEFIGIVLGDGGITKNQLCITLNSIADRYYIPYVTKLIKKLFNYKPSILNKKNAHAQVICVSGVNFINYLTSIGLKTGNKTKLQIAVPQWISQNPTLSRWCLRGLLDTDGGIFTHQYWVNNKHYSYLKLQFSNRSSPLRNFVFQTLRSNGFHPKYAGSKHVWLYSDSEARQYLQEIGSSNHRLIHKIQSV